MFLKDTCTLGEGGLRADLLFRSMPAANRGLGGDRKSLFETYHEVPSHRRRLSEFAVMLRDV